MSRPIVSVCWCLLTHSSTCLPTDVRTSSRARVDAVDLEGVQRVQAGRVDGGAELGAVHAVHSVPAVTSTARVGRAVGVTLIAAGRVGLTKGGQAEIGESASQSAIGS